MIGARVVAIDDCVIAEARRSTIDLEPHPGAGVLAVRIARNLCFRGRLNFVAAHGKGPVDWVTVMGNRLEGMALGIDVEDKDGGRRKNWRVLDNTSTLPSGSPRGSTMRFKRVDSVTVRDNTQPMKPNREMYLVGIDDCTDVTVADNELGPNAAGQVKNL